MSKHQLPLNPSFEQLKKQAKDLLKAHQTGDSQAAKRIRSSHPRLSSTSSEADILEGKLTLRDAQTVVAREYGFTSWQKLKAGTTGVADDAERIKQLAAKDPDLVARVVRTMLAAPQKAATLLFALGQDTSSHLMKHLSDREIEIVVSAISGLEDVSQQEQTDVLSEFDQIRHAGNGRPPRISQTHADFAYGALAQAVGRRRASQIFDRQEIAPSHELKTPPLKKEYVEAKKALQKQIARTPTRELNLDELTKLIVGLAEIARAEGVLEMARVAEGAADLESLIDNAFKWIADGTDPDMVTDLLDAEMHSLVGNFETRCRMIIGAVTAIQKGANPRLIEHQLMAYHKQS